MSEKSLKQDLDFLADKVDSAPGLPKLTREVIARVDRDDPAGEELTRAIRSDPPLVAHVLKFANSNYYGCPGEVAGLTEAISILGPSTVYNLARSYSKQQQYTAPESPDFPRRDFWNYSLAVGVGAKIICQKIGHDSEKQESAFSAGYLHAIGRAILDQHQHRELIKVLTRVNDEGVSMYESEKEVLGVTHCELGEAVLAHWNLPPVLTETARYYYLPAESDNQVVTIIHLASVLAKASDLGFSGDDDISYLDEEKVEELELENETIEVVLQEDLPREFNEIVVR